MHYRHFELRMLLIDCNPSVSFISFKLPQDES
jgi:hypothetical protein